MELTDDTKRIKLLVFWEYFQHYHSARAQALLQAAAARDIEVVFVAFSDVTLDGHESEIHPSIADRIITLLPGVKTANVSNVRVWPHFKKVLEDEKPDVVACIGWHGTVVRRAYTWCRKNSTKTIMMFSTQECDQKRTLLRELVKRIFLWAYVDGVFCGGSNHQDYIKKLGFRRTAIRSHYESIDVNDWATARSLAVKNAAVARSIFGLPKNYFFTSARLIPKKNIHGLLNSFSAYTKSAADRPWHLVIAGDGPLRHSLQDHASQLGVRQFVHFLGYLNLRDAQTVTSLASGFVLASSHYEQWGLVVNEAMAAFLPCIVSSKCGCARDLVIHGVNGYTFNPDCPSELTALLHKLAETTERKRQQMGMAAASQAKKYDLAAFCSNFLSLVVQVTHFNPYRI